MTKPFLQALVEMVQVLSVNWDANVDAVAGSSDIRSILEAVAFQVNDLSQRTDVALTDVRLRAILEAFGITQRPERASGGPLTFTRAVPSLDALLIPAGTEVRSAGEVYARTLVDAVIPGGGMTVTVPATCSTAGPAGNVPAGSMTLLVTPVRGVGSVTNPLPFTGGALAETLAEQRERFQMMLRALSRTDIAALVLLLEEYVMADGMRARRVQVLDAETAPGACQPGEMLVTVFRPGGLPPAFLADVRTVLRAHRAAGCVPRLQGTAGVPVPVTAHLNVRGVNLGAVDAARAAVGAYFDSLRFGQKVSRENLITALTNSSPFITEVTLALPAGDEPGRLTDVLVPGAVNITESLDGDQ